MNLIANVFRDQIIEMVQRTGFLQSLTYPELCRFVDLKTYVYSYMPDEILIEDGDYDMSLFVLLSGEVGVYKNGILVSTIQAGDCFGEISFISGKPRTADVRAEKQVIAIRLNVAAYNRLPIEIREKIKDSIILKLVSRIELMNNRHVEGQMESVG